MVRGRLNHEGEKSTLGDILHRETSGPTLLKGCPDLCRELALMDIESSLPKLSTLPPTGGE